MELQNSHGKFKFYFFTIAYLVLAIADGVLTYMASPDLSQEGNPLVTIWGAGWIVLLAVGVIGFAVYTVAVHYVFIRYNRIVIQCDGFKQYMSMLCFNRPDKFIWTLYKVPKLKSPAFSFWLANTCFAFTISFVLARIVVVAEWILYLNARIYLYNYAHYFRNNLPFQRFDVWVFIVSYIVLMAYWHYREYRINKTALLNSISK